LIDFGETKVILKYYFDKKIWQKIGCFFMSLQSLL
jgi:hypothetical protein